LENKWCSATAKEQEEGGGDGGNVAESPLEDLYEARESQL